MLSKKAKESSGVKLKNAGLTALGLVRICELNEFQSFTLVKDAASFQAL